MCYLHHTFNVTHTSRCVFSCFSGAKLFSSQRSTSKRCSTASRHVSVVHEERDWKNSKNIRSSLRWQSIIHSWSLQTMKRSCKLNVRFCIFINKYELFTALDPRLCFVWLWYQNSSDEQASGCVNILTVWTWISLVAARWNKIRRNWSLVNNLFSSLGNTYISSYVFSIVLANRKPVVHETFNIYLSLIKGLFIACQQKPPCTYEAAHKAEEKLDTLRVWILLWHMLQHAQSVLVQGSCNITLTLLSVLLSLSSPPPLNIPGSHWHAVSPDARV